MKKTAVFLMPLMLFISSTAALSSEKIPDSKLRVTVQQKADGKITNGYNVLELSCLDGNCSLSSVTLNQCGEAGSGRQGFYPKFQYSSTALGNLKAKNEGNAIVVQESGSDMIGAYVNNMRFEYLPAGDDKAFVTRLTGFSGGYFKNAPGLKMSFKLDYVPLTKSSQVMNLDCGVILPGIEKK